MERVLSYILIILFNSFCFSLVSVSWLPFRITRDFSIHVITLYTVSMIFGILATVRARLESEPIISPENRRHHLQISYAKLFVVFIFFLVTVFLDVLFIVEFIYRLPGLVKYATSKQVGHKVGVILLNFFDIVYQCTQCANMIWLVPKLNSGTRGLSSSGHLVNIAVNSALLIHNILFECKILFEGPQGHHHNPDPECMDPAVGVKHCVDGWNKLTVFRRQVSMYARPIRTEYFFLVILMLIKQWLHISKCNHSNGTQGTALEPINSERQPTNVERQCRDFKDNFGQHIAAVSPEIRCRYTDSNGSVADDVIIEGRQRFMPATDRFTNSCSKHNGLLRGAVIFTLAFAIVGLVLWIVGPVRSKWNLNVMADAFSIVLYAVAGFLAATSVYNYNFVIQIRIPNYRTNLRVDYETYLLVLSACAIYLLNFAQCLAHAAFLLLDDVHHDVIKNSTIDQNELHLLNVHLIMKSVYLLLEIAMTVPMILHFILLEKDMKMRDFTRFALPSFKAVLFLIIVGGLIVWTCESFRTTPFVGHAYSAPYYVFYGEWRYAAMRDCSIPLTAYFYLHFVLAAVDYATQTHKNSGDMLGHLSTAHVNHR